MNKKIVFKTIDESVKSFLIFPIITIKRKMSTHFMKFDLYTECFRRINTSLSIFGDIKKFYSQRCLI